MLRGLTLIYAASRTAFGVSSMAAPAATSRRTAGAAADGRALQSLVRAFGYRDVVMGVELARAARNGGDTRRWLLLSGICGTIDCLSLAAARDDLPDEAREMLALTAMDAISGLGLAALSR